MRNIRMRARVRDRDNQDQSTQRTALSLRGRALHYLSHREYSRKELTDKLSAFLNAGDDLDALLNSLETDGYLSDARFAESLIHRKADRFGNHRIISELKQHITDQNLLEDFHQQLLSSEQARAHAVYKKKFDHLPSTPIEYARQARFLAMRGFSAEVIATVLRNRHTEADDSIHCSPDTNHQE